MSYTALTWARSQMPRKADGSPHPAAKAVLMQLCDRADNEQQCYPGQKLLSQMTGYGLDTVGKAIEALEEQGYITRSQRRITKDSRKGHRTSDLYTVMVHRPPDDLSRGVAQPPALQKAVRRNRGPRPAPGPIVPTSRSDLVSVYGKQPDGDILRPKCANGWEERQALPTTRQGRWEDFRDNGPGPYAERRAMYNARTEEQEPPQWHYRSLPPISDEELWEGRQPTRKGRAAARIETPSTTPEPAPAPEISDDLKQTRRESLAALKPIDLTRRLRALPAWSGTTDTENP